MIGLDDHLKMIKMNVCFSLFSTHDWAVFCRAFVAFFTTGWFWWMCSTNYEHLG